jgi:hypothetical protein
MWPLVEDTSLGPLPDAARGIMALRERIGVWIGRSLETCCCLLLAFAPGKSPTHIGYEISGLSGEFNPRHFDF